MGYFIVASDSQNPSSIKTWFIVSRLFELPSVAASSEAAAVAATADDSKTNNDSTKVVIDGDSAADGHPKEKVCLVYQLLLQSLV
jgi:hypothetical protein